MQRAKSVHMSVFIQITCTANGEKWVLLIYFACIPKVESELCLLDSNEMNITFVR